MSPARLTGWEGLHHRSRKISIDGAGNAQPNAAPNLQLDQRHARRRRERKLHDTWPRMV